MLDEQLSHVGAQEAVEVRAVLQAKQTARLGLCRKGVTGNMELLWGYSCSVGQQDSIQMIPGPGALRMDGW